MSSEIGRDLVDHSEKWLLEPESKTGIPEDNNQDQLGEENDNLAAAQNHGNSLSNQHSSDETPVAVGLPVETSSGKASSSTDTGSLKDSNLETKEYRDEEVPPEPSTMESSKEILQSEDTDEEPSEENPGGAMSISGSSRNTGTSSTNTQSCTVSEQHLSEKIQGLSINSSTPPSQGSQDVYDPSKDGPSASSGDSSAQNLDGNNGDHGVKLSSSADNSGEASQDPLVTCGLSNDDIDEDGAGEENNTSSSESTESLCQDRNSEPRKLHCQPAEESGSKNFDNNRCERIENHQIDRVPDGEEAKPGESCIMAIPAEVRLDEEEHVEEPQQDQDVAPDNAEAHEEPKGEPQQNSNETPPDNERTDEGEHITESPEVEDMALPFEEQYPEGDITHRIYKRFPSMTEFEKFSRSCRGLGLPEKEISFSSDDERTSDERVERLLRTWKSFYGVKSHEYHTRLDCLVTEYLASNRFGNFNEDRSLERFEDTFQDIIIPEFTGVEPFNKFARWILKIPDCILVELKNNNSKNCFKYMMEVLKHWRMYASNDCTPRNIVHLKNGFFKSLGR